MAGIELAKGKQRAKWKEEFERQLDATEAAVVERDNTIATLKAEVKELKKGAHFTMSSVYVQQADCSYILINMRCCQLHGLWWCNRRQAGI